MKRYTWRLFLTFCVVVIFVAQGTSDSFALDPMFELDTKALRSKNPLIPKTPKTSKTDKPVSKTQAVGVTSQKTQSDSTEIKRVKEKRGSRRARVSSGRRTKQLRKSQNLVGAKKRHEIRRAQVSTSGSPSMVRHSFRLAAGREGSIQWTRDVWDRLLQPGRFENGPLVIQGRNFSLSLDPKRYPVFPAADGGKIVIDEGMTLSPMVKTLLREKDPGIRIVMGNPDDRKRFFSSLLAAAKFYSVEENFAVDFGSDPKLTVTSDFKIEKTSESLLKNEVVLVNVTGKHRGLPPQLLSFLDKEGFHVIDSSPAFSESPDGRKVLYSIEGSRQDTIVDELFSALSVPCEKNKDLLLDDGVLSGVTLSVRADCFSESNKRKVVVSFSEENPVQYTLLRLLELKGYRVVMLNPEDDFREISEKVLSSLGLPAVYGMQPLWVHDGTPFNVQLSGFVLAGSGRNGARRFLTNVPIDPLVGELARYKGFDVIVQ